MKDRFIVVCQADNQEFGEMVVATRRLFTFEDACRYASSINDKRSARVLPVAEYLEGFEGWRIQE